MKSFEPVYKELETLFIEKLPEYIEKINKEHNDGIILRKFENNRLEEDCIKIPSFKFNIEESEYCEKDRIIENTIFTISIEIKNHKNNEHSTNEFWRYLEAIQMMFDESEYNFIYKITGTKNKTVLIRMTVNS